MVGTGRRTVYCLRRSKATPSKGANASGMKLLAHGKAPHVWGSPTVVVDISVLSVGAGVACRLAPGAGVGGRSNGGSAAPASTTW